MAEPAPPSAVQKLKLQLFHRLQRRHRDAWQRYWGAFQQYLAAKLSLEEFHALAEELLGPDKHLHNKFVVALLSTAYQEAPDNQQPQPPLPPELRDHSGEGGGEATTPTNSDPLLQIIKEEGARHDSEQRSSEPQSRHNGRKRSHSGTSEESSSKQPHLSDSNQDRPRVDEQHPDHHSAQLLIGLSSAATDAPTRRD